jgi:hypothetical protein
MRRFHRFLVGTLMDLLSHSSRCAHLHTCTAAQTFYTHLYHCRHKIAVHTYTTAGTSSLHTPATLKPTSLLYTCKHKLAVHICTAKRTSSLHTCTTAGTSLLYKPAPLQARTPCCKDMHHCRHKLTACTQLHYCRHEFTALSTFTTSSTCLL